MNVSRTPLQINACVNLIISSTCRARYIAYCLRKRIIPEDVLAHTRATSKKEEPKGFIVLGDVVLPEEVACILNKGPKYSYEPSVPAHDLLALNRRVSSKADTEGRERCLLEEDCPTHAMDSHLLHLWNAKAGLERRWQRQCWNTTLRRRLTQLNKETETHAATRSRQNWESLCNRLEHNMSLPQTWNLFRHLIDSTQSKTHQKQIMTKLIHASEASPQELLQMLRGFPGNEEVHSLTRGLTFRAGVGPPPPALECRLPSETFLPITEIPDVFTHRRLSP
ncbi:hypothetical protein HPB49_003795 [Dermacentor silvarum]|uniref:Uncharacterized protein n=1 Tax=Dermacentor silvarum TaxID=543639 RepID=A0ACB8DMT5_DERSI|nr:hypothetical protein HPB49_003795 [Dermacentor silvarum]